MGETMRPEECTTIDCGDGITMRRVEGETFVVHRRGRFVGQFVGYVAASAAVEAARAE